MTTETTEPTNELIVFLDANIILESKRVTAPPPLLEGGGENGLIRILIVPKAVEEINAKKRDGSLDPHARAFDP